MSLLYSMPEIEMGGEPVGSDIDARPATPCDEAVVDSRGQELVPGNYARERSAERDAQYRAAATPYEHSDADDQETDEGLPHMRSTGGRAAGTYADVSAVTHGQRLGDVVEGDVGELVRGVSTGVYWEQTLAEMDVPEPRRDGQAPFAEVAPEHYTLEVEERMRGEFEADERNRSKALAAEVSGIDRAARSREAMRTRRPIRHSVSTSDDPWAGPAAQTVGWERVAPAEDEPVTVATVREGPDPRASLDQTTLGAVNQAAARLTEHFKGESAMGRASFSKCIARRVQEGADVMSATMAVKETLEQMSTIKQPIGSIDPYGQWETTVEAEVTTLWSPMHRSQYQVGLVTDEAGDTAKFVIWFAAGDKPTLAVGDRSRADRVRVNEYEGKETLAVVGDSDITVLERGDGPMTRRKRQTDEPQMAPWDVDSRAHAWISRLDMSRAAEVTRREMDRRHPALKVRRQIREAFGRLFATTAVQ